METPSVRKSGPASAGAVEGYRTAARKRVVVLAGGRIRLEAREQRNEREEIPSGVRQVGHHGVFQRPSDLTAGDIDQRPHVGDCNRFLHGRNPQREVHGRSLVEGDVHLLRYDGCESGHGGGDLILPERQERQQVIAGFICRRAAFGAGGKILRRYPDSGYNGPGGIGNMPIECSGDGLRHGIPPHVSKTVDRITLARLIYTPRID